jgi:hypothetical protein
MKSYYFQFYLESCACERELRNSFYGKVVSSRPVYLVGEAENSFVKLVEKLYQILP